MWSFAPDELEAIRANKDNKGPQAPDVIDVGLSFGPQAKEEGLIQPYKVSTWDSIPDDAKDAEGFWYGDYYGVMAFGVNTDLVDTAPTSWKDLTKPEYANAFALAGDPPQVADQFEATLVWLNDDAMVPGRAYWLKLAEALETPARRMTPSPTTNACSPRGWTTSPRVTPAPARWSRPSNMKASRLTAG